MPFWLLCLWQKADIVRKLQEMRRKARSAEKNAQKKNEANTLPNASTPVKNDKILVKTSTTPNQPSISENLARRQMPSRAKGGQKKTVTPSEKVSAATPTSNKAITPADDTTQPKKTTPPEKVILAKKTIIAKTTTVVKDVARKKILTKAKMVKAKKMTRTKLKTNLPIRVEMNMVCVQSLDFLFCKNKNFLFTFHFILVTCVIREIITFS